MLSIKPFDIIKTTKDIDAIFVISLNATCIDSFEILLPKGSFLFSNIENYCIPDKYIFTPHQPYQFNSINNLYQKHIVKYGEPLCNVYLIDYSNLKGNFETIMFFNYNQLNPLYLSHIHLVAYLYLDGKLNEIDPIKYLCFIANWKSLEQINAEYKKGIITKITAQKLLANQITSQIKLKQQ